LINITYYAFPVLGRVKYGKEKRKGQEEGKIAENQSIF
jgi:hypothetical protein